MTRATSDFAGDLHTIVKLETLAPIREFRIVGIADMLEQQNTGKVELPVRTDRAWRDRNLAQIDDRFQSAPLRLLERWNWAVLYPKIRRKPM